MIRGALGVGAWVGVGVCGWVWVGVGGCGVCAGLCWAGLVTTGACVADRGMRERKWEEGNGGADGVWGSGVGVSVERWVCGRVGWS